MDSFGFILIFLSGLLSLQTCSMMKGRTGDFSSWCGLEVNVYAMGQSLGPFWLTVPTTIEAGWTIMFLVLWFGAWLSESGDTFAGTGFHSCLCLSWCRMPGVLQPCFTPHSSQHVQKTQPWDISLIQAEIWIGEGSSLCKYLRKLDQAARAEKASFWTLCS